MGIESKGPASDSENATASSEESGVQETDELTNVDLAALLEFDDDELARILGLC